MAIYIGSEIIKNLLNNSRIDGKLKIVLFGITFKENVKDIRNSKIINLYDHLRQYGVNVLIYDPIANKEEVYDEYGINMVDYEDVEGLDAAVFCVAHDCFSKIRLTELKKRFKNKTPYIFDVKGIFSDSDVEKYGFKYWRL
jgi:UDP-N-acetyl-D-glucosamine/UDP-N-acetyl-D-galactosamine dehydrogenase